MSPSRVTPHEEGRAALYALTAALLLPGSSDDGERLLAARRETDVSHTVGDGNTLADVRSALGQLGSCAETVSRKWRIMSECCAKQ